MAANICEDQQWLRMYAGNQLWLRVYVWGSTVATNVVCWGSTVAAHVSSSIVIANINYVFSTIA